MSQYFEENNNLKNRKKIITIKFQNNNYRFSTNDGVFSKDKLDYGSKLLLETITKKRLEGKALDLGCGYGVIGLLLAITFPHLTVDMVDTTTRAITLAKENAINLNIKNVNIFQSDIYQNISQKYNYIITNPPIRAGKDIVRKFLFNAKEYLEPTGELWFVMRKDHGVKSIIKELDSSYLIIIEEKSKGFYIVKCTKK